VLKSFVGTGNEGRKYWQCMFRETLSQANTLPVSESDPWGDGPSFCHSPEGGRLVTHLNRLYLYAMYPLCVCGMLGLNEVDSDISVINAPRYCRESCLPCRMCWPAIPPDESAARWMSWFKARARRSPGWLFLTPKNDGIAASGL
jgi:hypothetical protein